MTQRGTSAAALFAEATRLRERALTMRRLVRQSQGSLALDDATFDHLMDQLTVANSKERDARQLQQEEDARRALVDVDAPTIAANAVDITTERLPVAAVAATVAWALPLGCMTLAGALAAGPSVGVDISPHLGLPPAKGYACAVLRRDSGGRFGLLLREDMGGVYIASLIETDVNDERGQLKEGDYLRSIDGHPVVHGSPQDETTSIPSITDARGSQPTPPNLAPRSMPPTNWVLGLTVAPPWAGGEQQDASCPDGREPWAAAAAAGAPMGALHVPHARAVPSADGVADGATGSCISATPSAAPAALTLHDARLRVRDAAERVRIEVWREAIRPAGQRLGEYKAQVEAEARMIGTRAKPHLERSGILPHLERTQSTLARTGESLGGVVKGVQESVQQQVYRMTGLPPIPDRLVSALRSERGLVVSVGSGFSVGLPTWQQLLAELARTAGVPWPPADGMGRTVDSPVGACLADHSHASLDAAQSRLVTQLGKEAACARMRQLLCGRPPSREMSARCDALFGLPIAALVTWNWDDALDGRCVTAPAADETFDDGCRTVLLARADGQPPPLLKLQGRLEHPESAILLDEDYARVRPVRDRFLRALYAESDHVVLHLGQSLDPSGVPGAIRRRVAGGQTERHFAVLPDVSAEQRAEAARQGVGVLTYDSSAIGHTEALCKILAAMGELARPRG